MTTSCCHFLGCSLRHVGDLGNMLQSAQGVASTQFRDEVISLQGQGSILGRSLVVRKSRLFPILNYIESTEFSTLFQIVFDDDIDN